MEFTPLPLAPEHTLLTLDSTFSPRHSGCLPAPSQPRPALLLLANVSSTLLLLTSTLPAFQAARFRGLAPSLGAFTSFIQRREPWQFDHPPVHSFPSFIHGILECQGEKRPSRLSGPAVFKPEHIFQRKASVEVLERNQINEQIRVGEVESWRLCSKAYILTGPHYEPLLCTP